MGYIYLGISIVFELIGTTLLKYTEGFTVLKPSLLCTGAYVICFYSFSKALLSINLSIGYAIWSGIGIVFSVFAGMFLFQERIDVMTVIGIVLILLGVIIVNLASSQA